MMEQWLTLYREEHSGTEWKQRVWLFALLSSRQYQELVEEGWQQSGNVILLEPPKKEGR